MYILTSILDVKLNGKKMKRKMISFKHISISMSFITDSKFLCSFKKLLTGNHWMENWLLTVRHIELVQKYYPGSLHSTASGTSALTDVIKINPFKKIKLQHFYKQVCRLLNFTTYFSIHWYGSIQITRPHRIKKIVELLTTSNKCIYSPRNPQIL